MIDTALEFERAIPRQPDFLPTLSTSKMEIPRDSAAMAIVSCGGFPPSYQSCSSGPVRNMARAKSAALAASMTTGPAGEMAAAVAAPAHAVEGSCTAVAH